MLTPLEFQEQILALIPNGTKGINEDAAAEWHNRIDIIIERLRVFQDELSE